MIPGGLCMTPENTPAAVLPFAHKTHWATTQKHTMEEKN